MTTTYKLEELAHEAEVAPRTVRYYVQRGLLPPPDFRGKDTTYGPEHLLRLRAIRRLQQAHLPLDAIQVRVAAASPAELQRIASSDVVSLHLPPAPAAHRSRSSSKETAGHRGPQADEAERWERFAVAHGVELHVRSDASPAARGIAREIKAQYAKHLTEE